MRMYEEILHMFVLPYMFVFARVMMRAAARAASP